MIRTPCFASCLCVRVPVRVTHLPADDILHAPVLHSNGQVTTLIEPAEGSVGGVTAGGVGPSLWGLGALPGGASGAASLRLDGVPLTLS